MDLLVEIGKAKFENPKRNSVHLVNDEEGNRLLNDIEHYPHAYVLACCMDRQVNAEIAWMVPVKIWRILGTFDFEVLQNISLEEWKHIFNSNSLHRFNDTMAEVFYSAIQTIKNDYNADASAIWKNNPSSSTVVYRFLQFKGVGVKIATMAANILARQYKIPFSDYYSIDVSPDVHVKRVMYRLGYIRKDATIEEIIYKARELYPEFPGIIDYSLWEIGRGCCRPSNPDCMNCMMKTECKTFNK
jgi:endonuclease III